MSSGCSITSRRTGPAASMLNSTAIASCDASPAQRSQNRRNPLQDRGFRSGLLLRSGPRGQGRRRSVDLWVFRPIVDVALRPSTGHGVPFRWVCDTQRDVVTPREFAEWHLEGTRRRATAWRTHIGVAVEDEVSQSEFGTPGMASRSHRVADAPEFPF